MAGVSTRESLLLQQFQSLYGTLPHIVASSPGRVNLIGEHVDYSGFPVLPMAVQYSSFIAAAVIKSKGKDSGRTVRLRNMNSQRFPEETFVLEEGASPLTYGVTFNRANLTWGQYFLAAYVGVLQQLAKDWDSDINQERRKQVLWGKGEEWLLLIDGDVPVGSGLSSSSALVCASAVTVTHLLSTLPESEGNWSGLGRLQLAALTAKCEQYVGAESGGMDQAISLLAKQGVAKLIEFNPIATHDVMLPPQTAFVLANSMKEHSVAGGMYNVRVAECRAAALALAALLRDNAAECGLSPGMVQSLNDLVSGKDGVRATLGQVADAVKGNDVEEGLQRMAQWVDKLLPEGGVLPDQVADLCGLPLAVVESRALSSLPSGCDVASFSLQLRKRARHVYTEASRVHAFRRVCEQTSKAEEGDTIVRLGELMNQSHESCKEDYECSCTELDELVQACRAAGVQGARLTGAGWGGWAVILLDGAQESDVDGFVESLWETHYKQMGERVAGRSREQCLVVTRPAAGARLWNVLKREEVLLLP